MKRVYAIAGMAALTAMCGFAQRQTIAVDKVKANETLIRELAKDSRSIQAGRIVEAMDRHLMASIASSRKFTVVGRADLKTLLEEQDLGQSGNVKAETAAQVGELTGAKYKLVTTVDHFQEETDRATFEGVTKLKRRFQLAAQAMVYDTTTGELLDASNIQVEKVDVVDLSPGVSNRPGARTDELMPQITKELADKTVTRLVEVVFPAKVIDVDDDVITINRGEGFFTKGDVISIFAPGKTVTDPDTGEKITIKGKAVGTAKIIDVDPTTAQAQIKGIDVKVGAQVSKVNK